MAAAPLSSMPPRPTFELTHRSVTADGFETTFAVNHLAPFLLTNLLLELLQNGAPSRIVNVTSTAFRRAQIDFDDLQASEASAESPHTVSRSSPTSCSPTSLPGVSRAPTQRSTACIRAGVVRTALGQGERFPLPLRMIWALLRPFMKSPEQGAQSTVYAATSPDLEGASGRFFIDSRQARSSKASYDEALAERLWTVSERLVGLS
jgi:NAD(P)-dependent dehydrogenase (short-subunit alcohol dehydrogenase family)